MMRAPELKLFSEKHKVTSLLSFSLALPWAFTLLLYPAPPPRPSHNPHRICTRSLSHSLALFLSPSRLPPLPRRPLLPAVLASLPPSWLTTALRVYVCTFVCVHVCVGGVGSWS
jgi:hypothetical protein